MNRVTYNDAEITKKGTSFILEWNRHLERQSSNHPTLEAAEAEYYVTLAHDYLGSAIRDNSKEERMELGRSIEYYGVDDNDQIRYPFVCPTCKDRVDVDSLRDHLRQHNPNVDHMDHDQVRQCYTVE